MAGTVPSSGPLRDLNRIEALLPRGLEAPLAKV